MQVSYGWSLWTWNQRKQWMMKSKILTKIYEELISMKLHSLHHQNVLNLHFIRKYQV